MPKGIFHLFERQIEKDKEREKGGGGASLHLLVYSPMTPIARAGPSKRQEPESQLCSPEIVTGR